MQEFIDKQSLDAGAGPPRVERIARMKKPYKTKSGSEAVKNRDVYMVTSKDGNQFMVGEDSKGRMYMYDAGGNLYYDSGLEEVGWYVVSISTCDNKLPLSSIHSWVANK